MTVHYRSFHLFVYPESLEDLPICLRKGLHRMHICAYGACAVVDMLIPCGLL